MSVLYINDGFCLKTLKAEIIQM